MHNINHSYKEMDNLEDSNSKLIKIKERIIKTDEVLRLINVKKREANILDKKYTKLLKKFSDKSNEVLNLQKEFQRFVENNEFKTKYELLKANFNEYVNTAEKKYQSACQENVFLTETCEDLKKKVERFDEKKNKTKNFKKLNDTLQDVKEQLKGSIHKYEELKSTSDKTISDLKQECKILEERRNETLKQLGKVRLDCDELRKTLESNKNSPEKSKLKLKIENLEIERDIVNQSHENDISQLKKDHEKEKKVLEEKLKELKKKISENDQAREKYFTELMKKHETEKKFLEEQIEKLKSKISEEAKKYEKELETKLNEVVNKVKETTSTKTDYEDIYNLEDILTEVHNLPLLMSPLSPASIVKPDIDDNLIEKEPSVYSVSVGTDDIIPTFIDSFTQTCKFLNENQHNIKVKSFTDSCTQTSDFVNINDVKFKPLKRPIILQKNNILEEIPTKKYITQIADY